jgi:hypothetical protein
VAWYWVVGTLLGVAALYECNVVAAAAPLCTTTLTGKIIHFAYKCCVCLFVRSQNQQLIFHYKTLKVIGFITETGCVYCAVRTGCLSTAQSVPRSKLSPSVIQTSQLMLYREIIAVCSQIHTKHINTLCGQNVEMLNVKLVVHIVTTVRYI